MNKNTFGLTIAICLILLLHDVLPATLMYVGIVVAGAVTIAMNLYEESRN